LLKGLILSNNFPWFRQVGVAYASDTDVYFIHTLFNNPRITSNFFHALQPLITKIDPKALIHCRAILYTKGEKLLEHGRHSDCPFLHNTCIFYVNTNNGFTRLSDNTCVESIENRALFFNGNDVHNSSTCTDQAGRFVLVISYF
jgi:hypothetical protein